MVVSTLFDERRPVQRRTIAGKPYYIVNEVTYMVMLQFCAWFVEQKRSEMKTRPGTPKQPKRSGRAR